MSQLIQTIPNFSEGKNPAFIEGLEKIAKEVPEIMILDVSSDVNHHRSSIAVLGGAKAIQEVCFQLVKYASQNIDMNQHQGEHPRMGATDVIPLIPVKNISLDECVVISQKIANRISEELGIPTYLYEASAKCQERRNLSNIRKGEFEGMQKKIQEEKWHPDFGPVKIHPTAGVTAVGARKPLVAFNVNLATDNLDIAKKIAKAIRSSSGGFRYCKAIGVNLPDKGIVQVSMDLVDYTQTPIHRVFETIKMEASRYGVQVLGSEVYGMIPAQALMDVAEHYLQLEGFESAQQVTEQRLIEEFL
ncbi:glutamate formimidoyltransferase [Facklamia sp. DSM 111018]|uniref:glutamate formimidoyltransferase n=1 Tax=Facklamia lactis TaxID=2749967 RepID=A0ABS0LTB7_9LACT|nr:glutamate formimidoyltransferase [Facklamia lactis]MBG9986524.1 glutamate formimidoyltransferase [Facklamia lactis]